MISFFSLKWSIISADNERGSKVEVDVAMCPLLSLFRREENRDGVTYVPYALHNYTTTYLLLCFPFT